MKNSIVLLCILLGNALHAQFKNKAALQPVTKTGFYSIAVTPELSSYVKTDFSDLRIMDEMEKQVPYIMEAKVIMWYDTVFAKLKIIKNDIYDSGRNVVEIANATGKAINSIGLLIRNTAVSRAVDINGSDDDMKWFSIVENGTIGKRDIRDTDKYLEVINFPLSSFKYFKLTIYNGNKDPLDVLATGVYRDLQYGYTYPYISNPASSFRQVDSSDGSSYIIINDSANVHKTVISIHFKVPRYFARSGSIVVDGHDLAVFKVSSDSIFSTHAPIFNAKAWMIKLFNGDNPPLKVVSVITQQEGNRAIAWLDSGKTYHLEMNDSLATAPIYDLENFKDSIPKKIAEVKFGDIVPIAATSAAPASSFFNQSWLWPAIIIVLLVLVFFTVRLTKEVGAKR